MPQSLTDVCLHIIFSTKHRAPSILPIYANSLYGQIGGISRERGSHLLCAGGMPDHIHLLVQSAASKR